MGLRIIDRRQKPLTEQEVACISDLVADQAKRHPDEEETLERDNVAEMTAKIRAVRANLTTTARARDIAVSLESDIRRHNLDFTKTQHPVLPKTLLDLL